MSLDEMLDLSGHVFSISCYIQSSGGKHALKKTSYLPNNICKTFAVFLRINLTFTAVFLERLTDHFHAFFNPQTPSEMNATNITPPT